MKPMFEPAMTELKPRPAQEFEKLTLCFVEQLYRLAYSRVGNAQDAEDIVQDTYIKAYRSFNGFRFEISVKNWLSQILLNTVRDHFRKGLRTVPTSNIDDVLDDDAAQPIDCSPEQRMCDEEIDPSLAKALTSLPENLLVPLLLREIHDATYEEIAHILDIPKGTVMSRLFRARALLRKRLSARKPTLELVSAFVAAPLAPEDSRGYVHEL
jgi:RNA polymerase sigma-70 factor (ECF subfamily)